MGIQEGLEQVRALISAALESAGRPQDSARLVAVSKTFPASDVETAYRCGQRLFGENRVQELQEKYPKLPADIEWHLIGHLQANKVRHALEQSAWIHSIDTLPLLERVVRLAGELGKEPRLLLEVNVSGEESKFGMKPDEVEGVLTQCPTPLCVGFMTVAPFDATESALHAVFAGLRDLRDRMESRLGRRFPELSMGMSGDFEIALAEGATLVRVGSAIFGHRDYGIAK